VCLVFSVEVEASSLDAFSSFSSSSLPSSLLDLDFFLGVRSDDTFSLSDDFSSARVFPLFLDKASSCCESVVTSEQFMVM